MLQKQKVFDNDHYDLPLIYNVNGHTLHFGRHEFCLITGFKFGFNSFVNLGKDEERFTGLSDEDSIRVCLLLSFEVIFMGHELGYAVDDVFLRMVDNLEAWNIWILESSSVTDHWWRKLSEEIPRGRTQSSSKEVSLQTRVKALEGLCNSLMILPKEIKSLKARAYKLVTIINVITPKTKATHVKHKVNTAGTKDKVESDDCVKSKKQEAKIMLNRLLEQRRLRLQLMLEEENSIKSIDRSNFTHMKLALEKCRTTKRRYVNVLRTPMEVDTEIKGPSMDTLKNQKNVLDAYMIKRCQDLKPWEEDLNRPLKCIDKIYCNYYLEQFLSSSRWRHCKFPWCNDVVVDRPF
ncbi:hypothetical protein Tco_0863827 [Tanacetum coccineum]